MAAGGVARPFVGQHLPKPVEVINAGVPGRTLPQNIYRLREEIFGYEPDMLISYHGYNGFSLLDAAIPPASGPPPPQYRPRPSKLLADAEYHARYGFPPIAPRVLRSRDITTSL